LLSDGSVLVPGGTFRENGGSGIYVDRFVADPDGWLAQPALAQAARVSLDARGDGGTGWSKAWKINFWARLRDGDRAHKLLGEQLRGSTLPNLFDNHPPFQIDGNFGATAGIAEMLLQSQQGEVHVLPALPRAWSQGAVNGLRCRGDLTVDLRWRSGEATQVVLHAGHTGPVTVRSDLLAGPYDLVDVESGETVAVTGNGRVRTFLAMQQHSYVLRRSNPASVLPRQHD